MIIKSKQKGFTLIELILVIVISSIVTVVVSRIIAAQLSSIYVSSTAVSTNAQTRLSMIRMTDEIGNIAHNGLSTSSTANSLTFVDTDNNTITYSLAGNSLMRNSNVLADNIQSLTFTYYNKTGAVISPPPSTATVYIQITLVTIVPSSSSSITTTIFLRNA